MAYKVIPKWKQRRPPKGAWFILDHRGVTIGATNRNLLKAAGFFFLAFLWNSVMIVFLAYAVANTMPHLGLPIPNWFPVPKTAYSGEVSLPMAVFFWDYITPSVLISLGLSIAFLFNLCGRTEVRIAGHRGTVFTGIGKLGWKRRFARSQLKSLDIHRSYDSEGADTVTVLLKTKTGEEISFGSFLSDERRLFLLDALRTSLIS